MSTSLTNDPVSDRDEVPPGSLFVDQMIEEGEVDVVEEPIDLADIAADGMETKTRSCSGRRDQKKPRLSAA